jgi:hypothetical protein
MKIYITKYLTDSSVSSTVQSHKYERPTKAIGDMIEVIRWDTDWSNKKLEYEIVEIRQYVEEVHMEDAQEFIDSLSDEQKKDIAKQISGFASEFRGGK